MSHTAPATAGGLARLAGQQEQIRGHRAPADTELEVRGKDDPAVFCYFAGKTAREDPASIISYPGF